MNDFTEMAKRMYEGSYFTIIGCDIKSDPVNVWVDYMNNILRSNGCPTVPMNKWEIFSGKEMNEEYGLTGQNRYEDDMMSLAFPIDRFKTDEELNKLAAIKLRVGARWFDDIVVNDLARERSKYNANG